MTPSPMSMRRIVIILGWSVAATASTLAAADAPVAEPRLIRTRLTLAPTAAQMATLPPFPARWYIAPQLALNLRATLAAAQVPSELSGRLAAAMVLQDDGSGLIVPEIAWLDEFTPAGRARWRVLLGLHRANDCHRWPLTLTTTALDAFAARPELGEVIRRMRRWGQTSGTRLVFSEAWALEDAFASAADRLAFFRTAFTTESPFLKLEIDAADIDVAAAAAYWQVNGRYRAIEPFLNAVLRVEDYDRIDLAHLLPRMARSLLDTFPPEFGAGRDLAVESGLVAAEFFSQAAPDSPVIDEGLAAWLQRECVVTTDSPQFGDILVFEDVTRTRWPYAAVYIADGQVFARQPTLFGPWRFLSAGEVGHLNPRLAAAPVAVYRRKEAQAGAVAPPFRVTGAPAAWRLPVALREGTRGPWGRLVSYDILLAPSGDLLESLPEPAREPEWKLLLPDPESVRAELASLEMPARTRRELFDLLRRSPRNRDGVVTARPSLDLVLRIPGPVRARLYRHLIPGTESDAYAQTIKIASRVPAEAWFAPDLLPEPMRTSVLRLTYPSGRSFAISDYGALFSVLPAEPEARLGALRTVFRTPAQVVLLEKPDPADVPALAEYWRGDTEKNLPALLGAFAADQDARYLDIVHLLSPLAREFLNLYAFAPVETPAASCFWTALNFDVAQPDSRLLVHAGRYGPEAGVAAEKLATDYIPLETPGALGDIIAYRETSGRRDLVHVAAFIADDIAFTKNGLGLMAPWCLMRRDDLDALYLDGDRVERRYFRRKPGAN